MDFKWAFETIHKDISLQKLSYYGIKDKELKWFSSYLTRHRQITKVNNVEWRINNVVIENVNNIINYLGFIIDRGLKLEYIQ